MIDELIVQPPIARILCTPKYLDRTGSSASDVAVRSGNQELITLLNAGIDNLREAAMPAHQGKFVAYFRVSTDRQGKSGLGFDAQRKSVLDYLNGGRWELTAEFTEVERQTQ